MKLDMSLYKYTLSRVNCKLALARLLHNTVFTIKTFLLKSFLVVKEFKIECTAQVLSECISVKNALTFILIIISTVLFGVRHSTRCQENVNCVVVRVKMPCAVQFKVSLLPVKAVQATIGFVWSKQWSRTLFNRVKFVKVFTRARLHLKESWFTCFALLRPEAGYELQVTWIIQHSITVMLNSNCYLETIDISREFLLYSKGVRVCENCYCRIPSK